MISVIIPTYNEQGVVGRTIGRVRDHDTNKLVQEIIVVDGGSTDGTAEEAELAGAKVIHGARKGRASQMNEGATNASADILYFVHADSIPPSSFSEFIDQAVKEGSVAGCFRLRFDFDHWFLKANAWFTRFDVNAFRFGDQSLFVRKAAFRREAGFREDHIVMEDQEIVARLRRYGTFKIIPKEIVTSSRKYLDNGVYRMQGIFFLIYFMYRLGYPQEKLVRAYKQLIAQNKV